MNLLILFVVLLKLGNFAKAQLSSCVTPNYEDGECIDLKNCPSLLKVFHRYAATKSESDRQFLQKSQCKTKKITVCCPIESEVDLLPSAPECGLSLTDKIFGGTRTELTEFPWTALLGKIRSNGPVEFFCGGSLISNRYVITAAHCITNSLNTVRLGEWDITQEIDCDHSLVNEQICAPKPIDIKVSQKIAHENYRKGVDDIGLIRLENQVTFNGFIQPVCLSSEIKSFIGKHLIVVGFGRTEYSGNSNSGIKLKVGIEAVPNEICEEKFRTKISSNQICAGGQKNKDSCNGDSGGGLLLKITDKGIPSWLLAGIVSYGTKRCGSEGVPAVYTKVDRYYSWIVDKMRP